MKRLVSKTVKHFFPYFGWVLFGDEAPVVYYDSHHMRKAWRKLHTDPRKAASRRKSKDPSIEDCLFDLWRPAWFTKYVSPVIRLWLVLGERDSLTIA